MSTNYDQLEEIWGTGAGYSEYHIDDQICYTLDGQTHIGTIIWVCAPSNDQGEQLPIRYIVKPETNGHCHDVVFSSNIVVGETQRQVLQANILTGVTEQAIIDMLATLSLPIVIREEIDDDGLPFYVWHLGAATPEQPFGVCVGIHREFLGALKLALEKALKGMQD